MQKNNVTLYSFPACNSSRRVKSWLKVNNVNFTEHRVLKDTLNPEDIIEMLKLSKEGFDEIISSRVSVGDKSIVDFEDLPISSLVKFLCENPSMLKKPILIYRDRLIVGWNKDTYRGIATKEFV